MLPSKSLLWGFLLNFIAVGSSKWWLLRTVDWHSQDHHCAGCFWFTFPHGQGSNRTKPASQNGFNQGEVTSMNSFTLSAYDNPRPPINSFAFTVCRLVLQQRQSGCSWILIDILVSLYRSVWCSCKNLRKEYSLLRVDGKLWTHPPFHSDQRKECKCSISRLQDIICSIAVLVLYCIWIKFRFKQYYSQLE
jgi:hypothetical protein